MNCSILIDLKTEITNAGNKAGIGGVYLWKFKRKRERGTKTMKYDNYQKILKKENNRPHNRQTIRAVIFQSKRYFVGLAFLLICAASGAAQIRVEGNSSSWTSAETIVANGTQIRFTATGTVNVGASGIFGPQGTRATSADRRFIFPSPAQPVYGLAIRLTSTANPDDELREDFAFPPNGTICFSASGHLWLIVNDHDHSDNTGAFTVNITPESCTPTNTAVRETRIRVADAQNTAINDAEVFVNGQRVGLTGIDGILRLPRLNLGDRIIARSRILESPTYRNNHQTGSSQNWKYRVYLTTAAIEGGGSRGDFVVSNPLETQELRLSPWNPLFGLHIVASVEWDASRAELDNLRDQILVPTSQFLYNATDGQFFVEQIEIADNAAFWGDADFRFYANLEVHPHVNLRTGGFLYGGIATWMNMRRAPTLTPDGWFSAMTCAHEFGHYGFGLRDEYFFNEDAAIFCATNLHSPGQFSSFQPQASCMMFKQAEAGKLCSGREENPHVMGTFPGDENCWLHLANQYRDSPERFTRRWFINTPDTRGAIPGTVPALPADWQPRVGIENGSRANLCQPMRMTVVNALREPVNNIETWVRTTSGQNILQGVSGGYDPGSGRVAFAVGEIPVTGIHIGDRIIANGGEYAITPADCSATARLDKNTGAGFMQLASYSSAFVQNNDYEFLAQEKSLQLVIAPDAFTLATGVEPTAGRQIQIRVKTDVALKSPPQVIVTQQGFAGAQTVEMTFNETDKSYLGIIAKLPEVAYVNVEVVAAHEKSVVRRLFNMVVSPVNPKDETEIFSSDGKFTTSIPVGALPADSRLSLTKSSVSPPGFDSGFVLVSDAYSIMASTDKLLKSDAAVRFQLPKQPANGLNKRNLEILRYNRQSQNWESIGGVFNSEVNVISARTNKLGEFVVVIRTANKSAGKFAVTDAELKPETSNSSGKCPVLVKFNGYITANGAGTVKYTFNRNDGAAAPVQTMEFAEAGTKLVSTSWTLGGVGLTNYDGWQILKILSPTEFETDRESGRFNMKCEQ